MIPSIIRKRFLLIFALLCLYQGVVIGQKKLIGKEFSGYASFYHPKFEGKKTASGHNFSNKKYTCAHRTLPFGTMLEVTSLRTHKTVVVRVNDRGPFVKGRVLDLSVAAAKKIGLSTRGVVKIQLKVVGSNGVVLLNTKTPFIEQDPEYEAALERDQSDLLLMKPDSLMLADSSNVRKLE